MARRLRRATHQPRRPIGKSFLVRGVCLLTNVLVQEVVETLGCSQPLYLQVLGLVGMTRRLSS